ncbi:hypothetical protein V0U79_07960 [Hyphobacterium sp. HN65]|uniref:Secreted protein n=1 Tax=Hyphobacterium lacteum TaxID=3116575 RepID=A0ABU7LQV6_9PROT|nr:hypothetical protein [Hyphobacterium sp. HN65]MEE2526298.1 hypothetical protein [Hyphobacterium sp. HN65]
MKNTLFAIGLAGLISAPLSAQEAFSAYTRTDGDVCTTLEEEADGGFYFYAVCPGYDGWALHLDGGEHGQRSTFRTNAAPIPDDQRPEVFNYPYSRGNFGEFHTVIEWRTRGEGGPAYAAIHRYYANALDDDGVTWSRISTLTVSALRDEAAGGTCMVAHVEADSVSNANRIAQDAADRIAPDFNCGTDSALLVNAAYPDVDAAISGGSYAR